MVKYLRHIIILSALLSATMAQADRVWVEDFVISPGETKTVELLLDNEITYQSLQCDFELPEGLNIVKNASNQPVFSATERTASHMIRGSQPSGTGPNHYRVAMITLGGSISGNSGAVATFQVVAAEGFSGHHVIAMSNIRVGDESQVSYTLEDYQCHVTTPITLAELVETGEEGVRYRLSDVLTTAFVTADGMAIYAKDDNGFAHKDEVPYVVAPGQRAYDRQSDFDQSNWVRINLPTAATDKYSGSMLSGIEGVLIDKLNPEITVTAMPVAGEAADYTANWYCPANFLEQPDFFFMPPKPQEYANIRWAVYREGAFYLPARTEAFNAFDLNGAVAADMSLYEGAETLTDNTVYELTAIVKRLPDNGKGSRRVAEVEPKITPVSELYEIYPITAVTNDIITGIETLVATPQDGLYYNLLGQPVSNPTPGIYIRNGKKVLVR